MRNRTTHSAMLAVGMGAAAGAVAATWLNKRRLRSVEPSAAPLIEPESAPLPLGRSADPELNSSLSRGGPPQGATSGAILGARKPFDDEATNEHPLDEIWNSAPEGAEGDQSEGYDAVNPENLGAVWLERATQTTHEARPYKSDATELAELEGLSVSEGTLSSSGLGGGEREDAEDDEDDNEIEYVVHVAEELAASRRRARR